MPVLETYSTLGTLRVSDAMHPGLISCSPDTLVRAVARMMATHRVHAILVTFHGDEELPGGGVWGVLTDVDVLRAAQSGDLDEVAAMLLAENPVPTVTTRDELAHAAQLMVEHDVSHLIVADPFTARPVGVLSTLDIARALAGFPETHPREMRR
jgi:CBS domain-containing protein